MLSILVVAEESSNYKELEECFINDYYVEFTSRLPSNIVDLSKLEFSFEILFYLKQITQPEISSISRLIKQKIIIFEVHSEQNFPYKIERLIPVSNRLILRASAMRGRIEYYRGVDEILALNAKHIELEDGEVILNGDVNTKAYYGDLLFRVGKNVIFGVRKKNIAIFSTDIFSNNAMIDGDNCRFLKNLVEVMLGGAEFL
ncbi:MAG: hypothetical protein NZ895_05635 [Archaeoglobaceae archaeon]|nr:hypothetical protein [Archaeoglobaceae archaeon]MCX8151788.1 hypothetical protein [Archaeoglobaceae archaeon]MDW8013187.1 hypothetical protein [Archaeoglobaceae archaeon]